MKLQETWITQATEEALKGEGNYRLGAVIVDKRGRVISRSSNKHTTHPKQQYYSIRAGQKLGRTLLHAEIGAIIRCRRSPVGIVVVRIGKAGALRLSRPCAGCYLAIQESGITDLWYSNSDGGMSYEQVF